MEAHKPDPKRPYKVVAMVVAGMIASALTQTVVTSNAWIVAVLTIVASGIAVYLTPNPVE